MTESDSTKIGRMDANVTNLMDWKKEHEIHDQQRFDKTFQYIKDGFDNLGERFDKIDTKIDTVWDERNAQKGAFKASKFAGMGVWTVLVLVANYVIGGPHKP